MYHIRVKTPLVAPRLFTPTPDGTLLGAEVFTTVELVQARIAELLAVSVANGYHWQIEVTHDDSP